MNALFASLKKRKSTCYDFSMKILKKRKLFPSFMPKNKHPLSLIFPVTCMFIQEQQGILRELF